MDKRVVLVGGLVLIGGLAYVLLARSSSGDDLGTGAGGGGGTKKEETYTETTTGPVDQAAPVFNIEAPTPIINLLPDLNYFTDFADNYTKKGSNSTQPTYETHGAPYKPAEPKKQVSYIQYDDRGFQKPLKDTIFGGL